MQSNKLLKRTAIIVSLLYLSVVFWGVFLKLGNVWAIHDTHDFMHTISVGERLRLGIIPFTSHSARLWRERALNAVLFAPYGVLLPVIDGKVRPARQALACFCLSLCFELSQLFFMFGAYATDDLITNTLSYFLGLLIYVRLLRPLGERRLHAVLQTVAVLLAPLYLFIVVQTFCQLPDYLYLFTCH